MYKTITNQVLTVTSAGTKVPTTALVGRKYIMLQNVGDYTIWIGNTSVAASTAGEGGYTLYPFGTWRENYTHLVDVYCITQNTSGSVFVQEGK